jgi:hypothetical protein
VAWIPFIPGGTDWANRRFIAPLRMAPGSWSEFSAMGAVFFIGVRRLIAARDSCLDSGHALTLAEGATNSLAARDVTL